MANRSIPSLPLDAPRMGNRFTRWLGRRLLRLLGWKLQGELPAQSRLVVAAAPHTSNWDFFIAMAAVLALGVKISYLMKKEAFFWPFKGLVMRLGGIPINRHAAEDTVDQLADWFRAKEHLWVVITPEGTRRKVDRWKTGFLRLAEQVKVPVFLVAWDYPDKTIYLDRTWPLTDDREADIAAIRTYYSKHYRGRNVENQ